MPTLKDEKAKPLIQSGLTLPDYIKLFKKLKDKKSKATALAEECGSLINQIATLHIPALMNELETDDFNVPGVGRVELETEAYPSVLKENTQKFYTALREAGHGALIVEYIFPQTLKAFVKEQLAANATLPDECKVTFIPTAKLLKPRKK